MMGRTSIRRTIHSYRSYLRLGYDTPITSAEVRDGIFYFRVAGQAELGWHLTNPTTYENGERLLDRLDRRPKR